MTTRTVLPGSAHWSARGGEGAEPRLMLSNAEQETERQLHVETQLQEVNKEERMKRDPYKWCLAVVLGLAAVIVMSAPAGAGPVAACGDFTGSGETRFDLTQSIVTTGVGTCLSFPANSVVFLNGFLVVGPGLDSGATGIRVGNNSFVWGPGIVR